MLKQTVVEYAEEVVKKYIGNVIVSVPENAKGKLPAIVLLHGAGESGGDIEAVRDNYVTDFISDMEKQGKKCGFILIVPQCESGNIWSPDEIIAMLTFLKKKYPIDPDRISITGWSMGARGTWDTICEYPDVFSCAVPISGFACYLRAPRISHIPVRAFHGLMDDVVPHTEALKMVRAMLHCGHSLNDKQIEFGSFRYRGHDIFGYVYNDPEIYSWMTSQSLKRNLELKKRIYEVEIESQRKEAEKQAAKEAEARALLNQIST